MASSEQQERGVARLARQADSMFAAGAVVVSILALLYAMQFSTLHTLNDVHSMTGALWIGINLFMGLVVRPILGSFSAKERTNVFR